jgi:hypothetical protein
MKHGTFKAVNQCIQDAHSKLQQSADCQRLSSNDFSVPAKGRSRAEWLAGNS